MRKYIFHTDYKYESKKESYLIWVEILDLEKKINKIATKDDIKDFFDKYSLGWFGTTSEDFFIPHLDNIQFLSSFKLLWPAREITKEKLSYNKKYIDCIVVPFNEFTHFNQILSTAKELEYTLSQSYRFYRSFFRFIKQIIASKNYFPGISKNAESNYELLFYPSIEKEIKNFFDDFSKHVPQISLIRHKTRLNEKQFIWNLALKILNSIITDILENGSTEEFLKKLSTLHEFFEIPFTKNSVLQNNDYKAWKRWSSHAASDIRLILSFKETEEEKKLWRIEYGIKYNKKIIKADKLFNKKIINNSDKTDYKLLKSIYISEILKAASMSIYIRDSLYSRNASFVDITQLELLNFLKNDTENLYRNGISIRYPKFWKNLKKITAKVTIRKKKSTSLYSKNIFNKNSLLQFNWEIVAGDKKIDRAQLEKYITENKDFIEIDGEYIELDINAINGIIKRLDNEEKKFKNGISFIEALNLDIDPSFEIDKSELFKDLVQRSKSKKGNYHKIGKIEGFQGELRHYQQEGVEIINFLESLGFGTILADDMGLGKTIQIIALIMAGAKSERTLIIAPTTILYNWEMELKKFAPSLKVYLHYGAKREKSLNEIIKKNNIILCSYGVLKRDLNIFLEHNFRRVIIDEAQNIKNPDSEQSRAVKELRTENKIALTGTPIENRLIELWSIMDFTNTGLLLSARRFAEKYEIPIMKFDNESKKEQLKEIISPFIIRRMKTDKSIIKDLPEKQETKIFLPLSEEQIALYDREIRRIEEDMYSNSSNKNKGRMLAAITKLKQICNHPVNFNKEDRNNNLTGRSSKLDRLVQMVNVINEEGRKVLIFTQFVAMGDLIKKHLSNNLGKEILFFNGSLNINKRKEMIKHFEENTEIPAMVLSLRAGGLGLNLTAANYVIHFDRWWNPAVENQAIDRVYRIGQKLNTFVYKFICKGTLEEKIDQLIESKLKLSDGIIPKGESVISDLSEERFLELIRRK